MNGETSHRAHIGPYRLLSRLGDGGAVHRAAGPDGRDVAIRLLPPGAAPDAERMREVLSPYVVDVLDCETAGPRPYVVTRFVPGRPLAETVAERGPMSGDALCLLAFGLAKALAAVHRTGLVHGDLGPGTVLVVDDAPVVVDFALAVAGEAAADVGAWAMTVAFAATGRLDAPAGALPAALRPLVEAAAHPDPGARPSAEDLAEAASRLDLPAVPAVPAARPPAERQTGPAKPVPRPETLTGAGTEGDARAPEMRVALGWARLLTALVVVVAIAVAIIAPIAGLVLSLAAVTLLRLADTRPEDGAQGPAGALGRTLLTVPYAAVVTAAVPLVLVAASAVGGRIDSLRACAFGAGAGAAVLWAAPGVRAPRRRLERMLLPLARRPRLVAAAAAGLGALALLAGVAAMTLDPSFAPMYGLQQALERSLDRLQHAVSGL
ncbi:phosphotransferase [Actinomadura bangladeshensis]|uniref:Protein kinase domain-containing protein n=1 Tax=Actinomadura bangladeshensis TaxID=453573 RepID=A0A4R4N416_9ACTN|nr:protein kinase [Actinomadura bangladeshensis]TDC03395.1 hypothetical protein E1284_38300 [Actinomadura bangladeshensis]